MTIVIEVQKISDLELKVLETVRDRKVKFLINQISLQRSENSGWFGKVEIELTA
jgi:hypothetical protein